MSDRAEKLVELLSQPAGAFRQRSESALSAVVERSGDRVTVEVPRAEMESGAADVLRNEGLDPEQWEVTGFRRSEWGEGKVATRFQFKRSQSVRVAQELGADEIAAIQSDVFGSRVPPNLDPQNTAIVAIADMQLGKYESAPEDTLARVFGSMTDAYERIALDPTVEHVVIAFMGDEIEGFVSQGGANVWRTTLTLVQQIRLVRRVMIAAMQTFSDLGLPLTMVAVPSNHGQAVRVQGKGVTAYDDDHGVEALLAVADAAKLSDKYHHVQFYVPETDELSVSLNLSGTHTVFTHGHLVKGGKYAEWVMRQAHNRHSVYHNSDLVIMGHWHSFAVQMSTDRMIVVCPANETESTWFRHSNGEGGYPGVVLLSTRGGHVHNIQLLRAEVDRG